MTESDMYIIVYKDPSGDQAGRWRAHYNGSVNDFQEASSLDDAVQALRSSSSSLVNAEVRNLTEGDDLYIIRKVQGDGYDYYGGEGAASSGTTRPIWVALGQAIEYEDAWEAYARAKEISIRVIVEARKRKNA